MTRAAPASLVDLPIHEILAHVNAIGKCLACFESLEETVPEVLAVVVDLVPLRSVVIIDERTGPPSATIWHTSAASEDSLQTAWLHAKEAFSYLQRLSPDAARQFDRDQLVARVPFDSASRFGADAQAAHPFVVLPLVTNHDPIFGIVQIELAKAANEAELAFVGGFATQLAMALDRHCAVKAQIELSVRERAAEKANEAKSYFLANVSHEIRTPLSAILGFSDLLLEPGHSESERKRFGATIQRNGTVLARLIDDILDLTKVEAGKLEVQIVEFSLKALMSDVLAMITGLVRHRELTVDLSIDRETPDLVKSDPVRLRQILLNIVGNAVKFTDHGSVWVGVHNTPSAVDGRDQIRFVVSDTGPGIRPEEAKRLFQPFTQARGETTRLYGGTGLGLALSRRLAHALGGDLVLLGSSPKGSTFEVSIDANLPSSPGTRPTATPAAPGVDRAQKNSAPLTGKRVLLVEDTLDNQVLFNTILRGKGANVDTRSNGVEGVEQALKQPYDVVLMDLQMPICDGFEAAAELRRRGFSTPIIALSAFAMKEDRERALRAGCNDHLTKPVSTDALVKRIVEVSRADLQ